MFEKVVSVNSLKRRMEIIWANDRNAVFFRDSPSVIPRAEIRCFGLRQTNFTGNVQQEQPAAVNHHENLKSTCGLSVKVSAHC